MPRAASLAAEIKKQIDTADIKYEVGPEQGEFAVFLNGQQIFSRLETRDFPEVADIVNTCKNS